VIQYIERTAELGTYKLLCHAAIEKHVKDLMEEIDEHIRKIGDWETCDTHYTYHVNEKVTPHSQLTRANENPDFWSSYAIKLIGSAVSAVETDKTMNAPPPPRSIRNVQVSFSAITQKNTGPKTVATASAAPETEESSTSSISNTNDNEDDNGMQHLKRKLAEIDLERSQIKTQQQKVEDNVSTLTQSMNKMGGDILNIRQDMAKLNQQLHEITLLLKQNIWHTGNFGESTIKLPPRKRRDKKDTNSFSSNEERFGSWASDC
jgi:hypothetical protein